MSVLALDTSNYTTSAAAFDGREGENVGRLLQVRPGELGLRQSDALFQHVKQLPQLMEQLASQGQLENIQAVGPDFDLDYDQNRAMLNTLNVGPTLDPRFQTYRYLRTPEEPVKRDSPRRAFLMIMWGIVGALTGAGVALLRRRTN